MSIGKKGGKMIASGVKRFPKAVNRPCESENIFNQMKKSVLFKQAMEFEIERFLTVEDYQEKSGLINKIIKSV